MIGRRSLLTALFCGSTLLSGGLCARADEDTSSPLATIAALQAALVRTARDLGNASVAERYRALEPAILATHDLPYIAEFALRRQWAALTADEKQRFIAAFQRLSVTTYAARFGKVAPDAFRPPEAGLPDASGRAQVTSAIKRPGQADVSMEYLLQQDENGAWRIINIVADGVSDLALKRAEYQRVFAAGGIEALIAELERQTQRLERG
jgi:phospholipid transport system substrate-binding protein